MIDIKGAIKRVPKPTVLLAGALVGVSVTTVLAVRTTYILAQDPQFVEADWKDKVRMSWKDYIPSAASYVTTVTSVVGLHVTHTAKLNSALSALGIATNVAETYKTVTTDTVGEKKAGEIREKVNEILLKQPQEDVIHQDIVTGGSGTLCLDTASGRYFVSDIETIRQRINDFNASLLGSSWMTLNEFYNALGLPDIGIGDDIGWVPDKIVEPIFGSALTPEGEPALVLDFTTGPRPYRQLY